MKNRDLANECGIVFYEARDGGWEKFACISSKGHDTEGGDHRHRIASAHEPLLDELPADGIELIPQTFDQMLDAHGMKE